MSERISLGVEVQGAVAHVKLKGPGKGNAMGPHFWSECPEVFESLDQDDAVRAIIVSGGDGNFTYGLDLMAMAGELGPMLAGTPSAKERLALLAQIERMQRAFDVIAGASKPVIAAVTGWCIGGGVDMITACDVRVCSADAKFSVREVKVGMVADLGSLQRLPLIVGEGHARELALTGKNVDAAHALRIGLVNSVHETAEATLRAAREIAEEIARNSPLVVRGIKGVMNERTRASVEAGLRHVAKHNAAFLPSRDLGEAFAAFAEKRAPKFDGS